MVVYFVIALLISLVPYVGTFAHSLLTPVFMGGLMLGCAAAERDGSLRVGHLFEGFQGAHFVPLMIIGVVNIAVWIAIALVGAAGIWGGVSMAQMQGMADPSEILRQWSNQLTGASVLGALVVLIVLAVLAMFNWFAPALVVFRGATAIEAMKLSFASCLRNWVPLLVYSLIGLAAVIGLGIVITIVMVAVGVGALSSGGGAGMMAFIGAILLAGTVVVALSLVVGPIVLGSVYAGYKDTLGGSEPALANPAYR
jgi:uncharacterized membrane protein